MTEFPMTPAFLMLLGAVVLALIPQRFRSAAFLLFPLGALALVWTLPDGISAQVPFAGYVLTLCSIDSLSRIFGTIFRSLPSPEGCTHFTSGRAKSRWPRSCTARVHLALSSQGIFLRSSCSGN